MGFSGADLERKRQLVAAGVSEGSSAGYDAARLEQLIDEREVAGTYPGGGGGGPIDADDITDATVLGKQLVRAINAAAARAVTGTITSAEAQALIDAAITSILGTAPAALNTLGELSDALADDASYAATIVTALSNKQPIDSDLTTIASLTATSDNFIQSVGGAWASRTVAQVRTSLGLNNIASRPSYVPTTCTNHFDPIFNVYNLKSSNMRRWQAALGRSMTGGFGEVSIVGASLEQGHIGSGYDRIRAWPLQMRDELSRHGVTVAGTGFVRLLDDVSADARWGYTGAWNGTDRDYSSLASAGTATFTTDKAGNQVVVGYYDNNPTAASFTVHVNGVLKATVTNTGPAGWKLTSVLTETIGVGQTVVITWVSGTILIKGVSVWNSTGGLLVNNVAQSGSSASGTGQAAWVDSSSAIRLGQVFSSVTTQQVNPDLVIIDLGHNDKLAAVSDATISAALTTIRNRYSSSDAILIGGTPLPGVADVAWETYIGSLYTLADTLDVPLIDFRNRFGNWTQLVANGLNGDGVAHLKVEAYADLGRSVGQLLSM